MFNSLFKKLGRGYRETEELLRAGKIFDAYDSVKNRKEEEARLLSGLFLIIMKKNKKGLEIILQVKATGENLLGKELFCEIVGTSFYTEGNYLEATIYFTEVLKINPENFNTLFNMTSIYLNKKDYESAYKNLSKMIILRPGDESVKRNYNMVKEKLNKN